MSSGFSKFDKYYRSILLSSFFTKGWGKPDDLKNIFNLRRQLGKREVAKTYVQPNNYPISITKDERKKDHRRLEGYFRTPFADYLPHLLPPESEKAYFQVVLPLENANQGRLKPVCVQYAGTGDHYFWRRREMMALPLLKERDVSSIILENPFYGLRKPKQQFRSCLQQVSDLFVMGACLILESLVIYDFAEKEGFCPIISHGISMGGHMASLGATVWDKPIGLVPCLSWTSGSQTFTKGVLTGAIPWDLLEKQYYSQDAYKEEVVKMIEFEDSAHFAGVSFAQQMDRLAEMELKKESLQNMKSDKSVPLAQRPLLSKQWLDKLGVSYKAIELKGNVSDNIHVDAKKDDLLESKLQSNSTAQQSKIRQMLPKIIRNDATGTEDRFHREAVYFMRGIMDECTHLKNYDTPYDPSLIYIIVAENDAYQPRDGIAALPDIWPGANIRFIEGEGHVASYLFKQDVFRQAIYDCIDKYVEKYMQRA